MLGDDDLSVSEAADALGTSPQTVRALLRKQELAGRKQAWGSRYVWVVSRSGVDAFLARHGRLDGQRRRPGPVRVLEPEEEREHEPTGDTLTLVGIPDVAPPVTVAAAEPAPPGPGAPRAPPPRPGARARPARPPPASRAPGARRPLVLQPRGGATGAVLVLGIPLLGCYVAARLYPGFLWFEEIHQEDVFRRVLAARVECYVVASLTVAV